MSLFSRKPHGAQTPASGPAKGPIAPARANRNRSQIVPHSRQEEHATDAPRGVDTNFCYSDEDES